MLQGKRLEEVEQNLLRELISNEYSEDRYLDYKRDFKLGKLSGTDQERKDRIEFLCDVDSFANGMGGDLVFGMAEVRGRASKIFPQQIANPDRIKQEIHQAIDAGIEPRIPNIQIHLTPVIEDEISGYLIIVRIPRSFNGPHRVKETRQFWARNSNGKYELDVNELRTSFLLGETQQKRHNEFKLERLAAIVSGRVPSPVDEYRPALVLHIVPAFFDGPIDLTQLYTQNGVATFPPLSFHRRFEETHRVSGFNLEGFYSKRLGQQGRLIPEYLLVCRNGAIEYVEGEVLEEGEQQRHISNADLEQSLLHSVVDIGGKSMNALGRCSAILQLLGIPGPYYVCLSLVHAEGVRLNGGRPIDRPVVSTHSVQVDTLPLVAEHLRPLFDILHQASSKVRSPAYDEKGNYKYRGG